MPENVTILSETPTSVTFKADSPTEHGGMPVTTWMLKYHEADSEEEYNTETYEEGRFFSFMNTKQTNAIMLFKCTRSIFGMNKQCLGLTPTHW